MEFKNGVRGTNCTAAGHCSRHHYWTSGQYQGDVCCWPVWVNGEELWQACPNLSNPTEYKPAFPLTPVQKAMPPQGHHYAGPGRYGKQQRPMWNGDNGFRSREDPDEG